MNFVYKLWIINLRIVNFEFLLRKVLGYLKCNSLVLKIVYFEVKKKIEIMKFYLKNFKGKLKCRK